MEISPLLLICILQVFGYFLYYDEMIMLAQSFEYYNNEQEFKNVMNTFNYFTMFFTFIYFMIADTFRYKPLIILSVISLLLRYLMFFLHPNLFLIHVTIILQALSGQWIKATLPYMYSIEDRSKYQKTTAYVEASEFICIFFSDLWDEIFVSNRAQGGFVQQASIYLNATMLCIVLPCAYMLPPSDSKRFGNTEGIENLLDMTENADTRNEEPHILDNLGTGIIRQWNNFKAAFTNHDVLKWSIWYSVMVYMSPLIHYYNTLLVDKSSDEPYGTGSLIYVILHLIRTLIIIFALIFYSRNPTNWKTRGDQILSWCSFVLLGITILEFFYLHQLFQIILMETFQIIAEVFCTICLWEIAQIIPRNSYALVIGFDMFVTQILDAISPFPANPRDFIDTKIIFIHAIFLALLGLGFGLLAKKGSSSQSEQRGVSMGRIAGS